MAASGVVLPGKNLKALSSRVSLFSCWTAKTPDHGKNVFTCQSRCMWTLVVAASVTIQYNQLETSLLLVNLLFIYQIFVNWKLVRLRNPIFNDGVWFDDPPRGWDFWYVSIRWILFPRYWGKWKFNPNFSTECHHHRPPRSHHCPVCDVCILKRNHHCFFTGACIGKNLKIDHW